MSEFFYRPPNAGVGDVIPFYADGEFQLYYLHLWRQNHGAGQVPGWYSLRTRDFVQYTEHGPCYIEGGTGCVLRVDGLYHLFYCIFPPGRQLICHAISRDSRTWETIAADTFGPDATIYDPRDWRDPFVFWNEEAGEYWMLLSGSVKGPSNRRGCVALCASRDLQHWEGRPPLYAPAIHISAHECPDLFQINDWWYLVYSAYTDRFATYYRMSRSSAGPWLSPPEDTFDGRAFYAAKSCSDGRRRYLFGWNPTKSENLFGWNPPAYAGLDYNTWDWGGSLVVHEIRQRADGTLAVQVPETVDQAFSQSLPLSFAARLGAWEIRDDHLSVAAPASFACALAQELPGQCKLSLSITFQETTRACGIMLRSNEDLDQAYYIRLEPNRDRIVFRSAIMYSEQGGKTFPYEVELERPLRLLPNKPYHIRIFVDDTVCEVYVEDEIAMSARLYDLRAGVWGVFVSEGSATFDQVCVETRS